MSKTVTFGGLEVGKEFRIKGYQSAYQKLSDFQTDGSGWFNAVGLFTSTVIDERFYFKPTDKVEVTNG